MMSLNEQNRSEFLQRIAEQLNRPLRYKPQAMPQAVNNYPKTRLTEFSKDELCQQFIDFATHGQKVDCVTSQPQKVIETLLLLCEKYGGGPIVLSGDERLTELAILPALEARYTTYIWQADDAQAEQNFAQAEQAKIGIVHAEAGLTESGGVVLFSAPHKGRAVSLLPESSIFIVRKSTLLPRVAQLAEQLHQK